MDTALVWFRNDLRVLDNSSLTAAITGARSVIGLYCFDPRHYEVTSFGFKKTEKYRAQFLRETIADLRGNLQELHISLLVYQEKPEVIIPNLLDTYNISKIYFQKEWTQEEKRVPEAVQAACPWLKMYAQYDQFLFHPEDIPYTSFNEIPQIFTQFRKKCESASSIRPLQDAIKQLPKDNLINISNNIPTLEELSLEQFDKDHRTAFPWEGGETQAWSRLNHYFWQTKRLSYYKKTRNGLIGEDYSSKLSAWLANGSISARQIYWEVQQFEKEIKKNQDTYWLIFELIWRDYFKYISLKHGNSLFKLGGILHKNYDWQHSKKDQTDWINGHTIYDFVNANMIELKKTGWMSNRGRQNVASFWAKEQQQDWRIGASYFESMLVDYDVHSNYGNWIYNAGVGNDPRDRRFNIKSQADRYDSDGKYQRLWLQDKLF